VKSGCSKCLILCLFSGSLTYAEPAAGQEDCRLLSNLVDNCSFVTDLDGWIQDWETFSLDPDGYAAPGSAHTMNTVKNSRFGK